MSGKELPVQVTIVTTRISKVSSAFASADMDSLFSLSFIHQSQNHDNHWHLFIYTSIHCRVYIYIDWICFIHVHVINIWKDVWEESSTDKGMWTCSYFRKLFQIIGLTLNTFCVFKLKIEILHLGLLWKLSSIKYIFLKMFWQDCVTYMH